MWSKGDGAFGRLRISNRAERMTLVGQRRGSRRLRASAPVKPPSVSQSVSSSRHHRLWEKGESGPRPLINDDPFCYPRRNLPQPHPLKPRYRETMATRHSLTSLARAAVPSVQRAERRLLSTAARPPWPLNAAVSAAVSAHSKSRRQPRTTTANTSLATLSPRHFFSTEKPQPQTESKIWSFEQVSKLIADPTHKLAIIGTFAPLPFPPP
jgi:hypothetical protein